MVLVHGIHVLISKGKVLCPESTFDSGSPESGLKITLKTLFRPSLKRVFSWEVSMKGLEIEKVSVPPGNYIKRFGELEAAEISKCSLEIIHNHSVNILVYDEEVYYLVWD